MSRFTNRLVQTLAPTTVVSAHCDIPCGIYDPHGAVLAAQTVAKMVELIGALDGSSPADRNKFVRCVAVKEQHAELVKHEVQVIWSDYFKPEHLAATRTSTPRSGTCSSWPARTSRTSMPRPRPSSRPRSRSSPTSSGRPRSSPRVGGGGIVDNDRH